MPTLSKRTRWVLGSTLVVAVIVLAWVATQIWPLGGPGSEVVVKVVPGESVSTLASDLEAKGVIGSAWLFRLDTAVLGAPVVLTGNYVIEQNSSFSAVKSVFSNGPNALIVAVTPGRTLREITLDVAADKGSRYATEFQQTAQRSVASSPFHPNGSMEGLLGVGTYVITPHESASSLFGAMEHAFVRQAAAVGIVPGRTINGLTAYQAVIAASIVEKEGYYRKNMGPVARVILNRLARGGGLQMDSTILYALGADGGAVTHAMLQVNSPYNTYLHPGLTPTPICQVSSYAMASVVDPPSGHWLYFTLVSRDGTMAFSDTFAQQLANERLAASRGL